MSGGGGGIYGDADLNYADLTFSENFLVSSYIADAVESAAVTGPYAPGITVTAYRQSNIPGYVYVYTGFQNVDDLQLPSIPAGLTDLIYKAEHGATPQEAKNLANYYNQELSKSHKVSTTDIPGGFDPGTDGLYKLPAYEVTFADGSSFIFTTTGGPPDQNGVPVEAMETINGNPSYSFGDGWR